MVPTFTSIEFSTEKDELRLWLTLLKTDPSRSAFILRCLRLSKEQIYEITQSNYIYIGLILLYQNSDPNSCISVNIEKRKIRIINTMSIKIR